MRGEDRAVLGLGYVGRGGGGVNFNPGWSLVVRHRLRRAGDLRRRPRWPVGFSAGGGCGLRAAAQEVVWAGGFGAGGVVVGWAS